MQGRTLRIRIEFRLSGSGGQGLLLAGIALAEVAIMEGTNATQTQSYGPKARVGAIKSEVVVSMPAGMDDGIRAMKAIIMEIADVFALNKSGRRGAERATLEPREAFDDADGGAPRCS